MPNNVLNYKTMKYDRSKNKTSLIIKRVKTRYKPTPDILQSNTCKVSARELEFYPGKQGRKSQ